jgi:hypothetical protein
MEKINLSTVKLVRGESKGRAKGVTISEAVSWYNGQAPSSYPDNVCPLITGLLNEMTAQDMRKWRKSNKDIFSSSFSPFIPHISGADCGLWALQSRVAYLIEVFSGKRVVNIEAYKEWSGEAVKFAPSELRFQVLGSKGEEICSSKPESLGDKIAKYGAQCLKNQGGDAESLAIFCRYCVKALVLQSEESSLEILRALVIGCPIA